MEKILLTGATGFLGESLLVSLLKKHYVYVIVRNSKKESAIERIENIIKKFQLSNEKKTNLKVLIGDLTMTKLGMTDSDYEEVTNNITSIIHSAASIEFNLEYKDAKNINYYGTLELIKLAELIGDKFQKFIHISTAYVAGLSTQKFNGFMLEEGQNFSNTYEQTKYETEILLNNRMKDGFPAMILRPSIISPSSVDGYSHENCIIMNMMRLYGRGLLEVFNCSATASLNLVPIDYVVKVILYFFENIQLSKTYNITYKNNVSIKSITKYVHTQLGQDNPMFCEQEENYKRYPKNLELLFHYMRFSHEFDNSDFLEKNKLFEEPKIDRDYFEKIISYGKRNGFL